MPEVILQFSKVKEFEIIKSSFHITDFSKQERPFEDSSGGTQKSNGGAEFYRVEIKSDHGWTFLT